MRLAHRIRMLRIKLSANLLIFRARRAYANRPHVQSAHMIGPTVPKTLRDHGITPLYAVLLAILFSVIVFASDYLRKDDPITPSFSCEPSQSILRKLT